MEALVPARFDPLIEKWRPLEQVDLGSGSSMCIVTWNVWFDRSELAARGAALVEALRECRADVIVLQEMTEPLLKMILASDWMRDRYAISDWRGGTVVPYGVLMLMRRLPSRLSLHPLPSRLWRKLLLAVFETTAGPLAVATVHLESMARSESIRAAQLTEVFRLLEPFPEVVLLGDFNFCDSDSDENARLDPAYVDLWSKLHPLEAGYTKDSAVNTMLGRQKHEPVQVRYDRIFLRTSTAGWQAEAIDRLGMESISNTQPPLYVSDHFGLRVRLHGSDASAQMPV